MYSVSTKKVIKKKWKYDNFEQIQNLEGFLLPVRGNEFVICDQKIKNIKIIDVGLAKPLVSSYVNKKYKRLLAGLTELLISDDDTGESFRLVLDRIEKFRMEIKNKYRIFLEKKELEIMAKQLSALQKEARREFALLQSNLISMNENNKSR